MRIIEVVDYQHSWADEFSEEKKILAELLENLNPSIFHIGSTSVVGLSAKPTIDILIEVEHIDFIDKYSDQFKNLGYDVKGEFGIAGRRYFQKGEIIHTHHVHIFSKNDDNILRHIAFRDYLRSFPEVADEYGKLKKRVAISCNNSSSIYGAGKNDFIKLHEAKAVAWFRDTRQGSGS